MTDDEFWEPIRAAQQAVTESRRPTLSERSEQMPLNEDPDALSDEEYDALSAAVRASAEGDPPCPAAIPADVLAESLARLDAQDG